MRKKEEILEGSQFLFISPKKSVKLALKGAEKKQERIITSPSILCRYRNEIQAGQKKSFAPLDLAQLQVDVLFTDRKVYKPREPVHLFCLAPALASGTERLEILWNGQVLETRSIEISPEGLGYAVLEDLPEGSYHIQSFYGGRDLRGSCDFTVAVHTLSLLTATLKSHTLDSQRLELVLGLESFSFPWSGSADVGLFCGFCDIVVEEKNLTCDKGEIRGFFDLSGHTGPFSIHIRTPGGDTASVFLPGTRADEREALVISPLGKIVKAALNPSGAGDTEVRGLFLSTSGVNNPPLILESTVGEEARFTATSALDRLMLVAVDPVTGESVGREEENIKAGDVFTLAVHSPYSIVLAGTMGSEAWEGYAVVVRPAKSALRVAHPALVEPSEEVPVTISTDRPGKCLLMVCDARLTQEDPLQKCASQLFAHMKGSLSSLREGSVKPPEAAQATPILRRLAHGLPRAFAMMEEPGLMGRQFSAPAAAQFGDSAVFAPAPLGGMPDILMAAAPAMMEEEASDLDLGPEQMEQAPVRMDFPELVHCELFDLEGTLEKRVRMGDSLGLWSVRVFLIDGLDIVRYKAEVRTHKETFLEVDLPALMSPQDEAFVNVTARGPGACTLSLIAASTRMQQEFENAWSGTFLLKGPGEVMGELASSKGSDRLSRVIDYGGRETLITSRLVIMKPGERIAAPRMVLYPSPAEFLRDCVEELIKYPFGCAEQTSAKMTGMAVLLRSIRSGHFKNGSDRIERLLKEGATRMQLFYKNGLFSLWEGGTASVDVTRRVLVNLMPLQEIAFEPVMAMLKGAGERLLKEKVRDNALLPLDRKFAAPIEGLADAVNAYLKGVDEKKALGYIVRHAIEENGLAYWKDPSCWGGAVEATCSAVRALARSGSHRALCEKGFRFLCGKLVQGRFYSTADTKAFVELLPDFPIDARGVIRIGGREERLEEVRVVQEVEAVGSLLARIDEEATVDYRSVRSTFRGKAVLETSHLGAGQKTRLTIKPLEESLCPMVKVFLPPLLASLEGGANLQRIHRPVKGDAITLDVVGVRKGKGSIFAVLHDMYDPEKIGVLPPLDVGVE